jgi:hypothetical protein
MIVWGGGGSGGETSTGGLYDPATNTWTAMSTVGAPAARYGHTAVWTGSRMVVWGGGYHDGASVVPLDTGGIYDPAGDAWTAMTLVGTPDPRLAHTAVWTGRRMVVWGGYRPEGTAVVPFDTGGIFEDLGSLLPPTDFYTVTPCRVADTRNPDGPTGGPILAGGSTRSFPVTGGACGIPATALAVSVNLTAVGAVANGYLTLFPGDAPGPPLASHVNFAAGVTRANNAVAALAGDGTGTIKVRNGSVGAVHFVLDVNGYFE